MIELNHLTIFNTIWCGALFDSYSIAKIWKPGIFQGRGKSKDYFEGWYFKSVSADEQTACAIIPGVSISRDKDKSHSFIMFIDARNQKLHYFKYPVEEFKSGNDNFSFSIGSNFFSQKGVKLELDDGVNSISADLQFKNITAWPVKLFTPGAMGWYSFVPLMECYHGVLSFNHHITGYIRLNDTMIDITDGKGYIEKDWGTSMPSSWIWMQTNHFDDDGISLFVSIAKIPWIRNYFTGYIFGFLYKDKLYRMATYTGAKIKHLLITKDKIEISVEDKRYIMEIDADRIEGVDLPAPSMGEMTSKVNESLKSKINVKFYKRVNGSNQLKFSGTGRNAGLEFVGDIGELLSGFKNSNL